MNLLIRKGCTADLKEIKTLFSETIKSVCSAHYNDAQITAWLKGTEDDERWLSMAESQHLFVACLNQQIVGFCSLANKNYIDFLFVHKDYQKLGIASGLYICVEQQARQSLQTQLTADVSITAKPFFENKGFTVVKEQKAVRENVWLTNYKMLKNLL